MNPELEPARDPIETLRADAAFLRRYLESNVVTVYTCNKLGGITNSCAAVQIPDWAVKQRLDDIDASIARFGGTK
jgi:hypothetical protein